MGGLSALFGSKPQVPDLPITNLTDAQQQAIAANKAAAPGAMDLANITGDEILALMRSGMPGFDDIRSKSSSNIQDLLAGKIPGDVSDAVTNNAAVKSLRGGFGGSGMHSDLLARDLGLTSLHLMDKGLSSAESWMAQTERMMSPAMANFQSMFINPTQEYQTENEQNLQQFQRKWMSAQIGAMPDPVVRGIQDTVMQLLGRNSAGPANGNQYSSIQSPGTKSISDGWRGGWDNAPGSNTIYTGPQSAESVGGSDAEGMSSSWGGTDVPDVSSIDFSAFA